MGEGRRGGAALVLLAVLGLGVAGCSAEGSAESVDAPRAAVTPTARPSASPPATSAAGPVVGPTTGPATGRPVGRPAEKDGKRIRRLARLAEMARTAEREAAARESASAVPPAAPSTPVQGADVSWPQCPVGMGIWERRTLGLPMPLPAARFVIVGLTNGPGFTANPCLRAQVGWVRSHHVLAAAYAVVSLPSPAQLAAHGTDGPFPVAGSAGRLGRLANTGYRQALFAVTTMHGADLQTPVVWLDVEHVPDFEWSSDRQANAAVVQGAVRAYVDAGYRVGIYSTPLIWADVVGDLALGLPEWRPAGESSRPAALDRCGGDWSVQGGPAVLVQWVVDRRDHDSTCPGAVDRMDGWFHHY